MKTAFTSIVILIAATCAIAQTTAPATQSAVQSHNVELSVRPAAAPEPALKYQLIPQFEEQTPGNAAPLYMMGFLSMNLAAGESDRLGDQVQASNDRFSLADAKAILEKNRGALQQIDLAARREHCNWDLPLREQGFNTLLPHLAHCRNAARLLSLRARVQIAEGHFDEAIHTLQTGFALVGHLKNDAVLIQGIVAVAISNVLLDRVEQLEQSPGAPNLYWALTNLPGPLVDLRAMADEEHLSSWLVMPELKGRRADQLSDEEYQNVVRKFHHFVAMATANLTALGADLKMVADVARASGVARQWLVSHGYTEPQLKEMTTVKIVGIYYIESYQQVSDDTYKWMPLPYWQQRQGLLKADDAIRKAHADGDLNPLMELVPAINRICLRVAEAERRLAMLRTVEALRAYAATHDGKTPASLSDLTETPSSIDPMTGRDFDYEIAGAVATLRSTGAKGREDEMAIYRVTMGRP